MHGTPPAVALAALRLSSSVNSGRLAGSSLPVSLTPSLLRTLLERTRPQSDTWKCITFACAPRASMGSVVKLSIGRVRRQQPGGMTKQGKGRAQSDSSSMSVRQTVRPLVCHAFNAFYAVLVSSLLAALCLTSQSREKMQRYQCK